MGGPPLIYPPHSTGQRRFSEKTMKNRRGRTLKLAIRKFPLLIRAVWFVTSTVFLLLPSPQSWTTASPSRQDEPLRLESRLVSVPVAVFAKKGGYVTGLIASDFEVLENGKPQQLAFFSTEQNELVSRPLAVVFALDSSGSAAQTIREQRAAADAFLRQFSQNQLVAVTRFSTRADTLVQFTTDRRAIDEAFARHVQLKGETAIFDGVMHAIQQFSSLPKETAERRRIVILITDGLDNSSFIRAQDIIATANEQDVNIYVIYLPLYVPGPNGRLEPRKTAQGFDRLAPQTGGHLFQVGDLQSALDPSRNTDLSKVFAKIIQELHSLYYIGYYPADAHFHGEFRNIQVKVHRSGVKVRQFRRGYRAWPGQSKSEIRKK